MRNSEIDWQIKLIIRFKLLDFVRFTVSIRTNEAINNVTSLTVVIFHIFVKLYLIKIKIVRNGRQAKANANFIFITIAYQLKVDKEIQQHQMQHEIQ